MAQRFQITTFEKNSPLFSRVAQQSIVTGLDRPSVMGRIKHLTVPERKDIRDRLYTRGEATYKDTDGKLNLVKMTRKR